MYIYCVLYCCWKIFTAGLQTYWLSCLQKYPSKHPIEHPKNQQPTCAQIKTLGQLKMSSTLLIFEILISLATIADMPKGCVCYIFVCFSVLKESTWETWKNVVSLYKLFSFLRKSNFWILDIQNSWHHQMLKHKTWNTFNWITYKVNTVCWWNLVSLCHITKEKNWPFLFAKN